MQKEKENGRARERRERDKSEGKLMARFTVAGGAGGAGETAAKRVYSFGMIKATREGGPATMHAPLLSVTLSLIFSSGVFHGVTKSFLRQMSSEISTFARSSRSAANGRSFLGLDKTNAACGGVMVP